MSVYLETPLGHPIPPYKGHSPDHAITVHLPTWQTILDFIDQKPALTQQFKNMYPRNMVVAQVKSLVDVIVVKYGQEGQSCLLFATEQFAGECKEYATSTRLEERAILADEVTIRAIDIHRRLWAVFFPIAKTSTLIEFWMHAGVGISSRLAEDCLKHIESLREASPEVLFRRIEEAPAHSQIRERVADLLERAPVGPPRNKVSPSDIYLYQTGMAAIYHLNGYFSRLHPAKSNKEWNKTTILFGFAFHATPHALKDFGPAKYQFYGAGTEYEELEEFAKNEVQAGREIQALWTEFPANPLLTTPDLERLRTLADKYHFPLIVDETVGSFCNLDVMGSGGADLVVTSLTKSFNGYSDAMAASITLNPAGQMYYELKIMFEKLYQNFLFNGDAIVVEKNSRDYLERSKKINRNAEAVADYLDNRIRKGKTALKKVHYPKMNVSRGLYESRMRSATPEYTTGYGGLFSVEFDTIAATIAFYDTIGKYIYIGPHLGAHVTLVLAYTKRTYDKDLKAIAAIGQNERQLRVSAGLEETEHLLDAFRIAVDAADVVNAETKKANGVHTA